MLFILHISNYRQAQPDPCPRFNPILIRIALVSPDGSLHNHHYSQFLLRHLQSNCQAALEIGCGKGEFSRQLARTSARAYWLLICHLR
jgi:2-polyprenyl-3-methyl-5-hydroxy-6-metoxy-1,4-benzoquinol methylase